jgi:lysine-N-methylase
MWQRLFLLGIFCRRLDGVAGGEFESKSAGKSGGRSKLGVLEFLGEFEASVASGKLRSAMEAMETLATDNSSQLDIVLRLAGMLLERSNTHPRFSECVRAFTSGIGNEPGATLESLAGHYAVAHDRFYAPFFDRHPYILENYLINTMARCQFPLGPKMPAEAAPSMAHEYAVLTAQFALMKGLLIGVAGSHGEAFSTEHVVHTVQAASRHFEHHPHFLKQAHELLVESKMNDPRGLAVLLRNREAAVGTPAIAVYEEVARSRAS